MSKVSSFKGKFGFTKYAKINRFLKRFKFSRKKKRKRKYVTRVAHTVVARLRICFLAHNYLSFFLLLTTVLEFSGLFHEQSKISKM